MKFIKFVLHSKKIIVGLLLSLLLLPVYALESLDKYIPEENSFFEFFPDSIKGTGEAYCLDGAVNGPFSFTLDKDLKNKRFIFTSQSVISEVKTYTNDKLEIESHFTQFAREQAEVLKKLGYDKRAFFRDKKKWILHINYFSNRSSKNRVEIPIDRNSLETDALFLYLQGLLLKGMKKDFRFDLVSIEKGMKVSANCRLFEKQDFREFSPDTDFPKGTDAVVKKIKNFYVYEITMEGVLSFMVWTKWYMAFEYDPPHIFVAYWGGDGLDKELFYIKEKSFTPVQ